jgi:outer membrane protein assembly factor BamB
LAWAKHLGVPKNQYGHASSLVPWQDRLLVQFDQGEAGQNRSRLYAFDAATGRLVWERTRPVPESWATPCVADTPTGPQIITLGGALVMAYTATDGTELWRGELLTGEIAPSPIFAGGLVLAVSPTDKLIGLRTEGRGDITQSHLAWMAEDNIPDISSPASNGDLVFVATTYGTVTCYDVKDGKKQWEHELEFELNATPTIARDRLLILGKHGEVLIAEASRQFKQAARFEMGEPILASPAFLADRCFIRTTQTLFCIGAKPAAPAAPEVKP